MAIRHHLLCCVCGLSVVVSSGCESVDPQGAQGQAAESQRAVVGEGSRATGPIRLGPRSAWVRLNPAGPELYSPRVSPDGKWVAAAGRGGRGLYVVASAARGSVAAVDPSRVGPWAWASGPVALHFGIAGEAPRVYLPDRRVIATRGAKTPWETSVDEELGERIWAGPDGAWYHHPKLGTITRVPAGQKPLVVVNDEAWGAVASPDGRFVAYCTGRLSDSRLFVHDALQRRTRELGPGVHPVWIPGRAEVIYAVPGELERRPGISTFRGAELWLSDALTGAHRALTRSRDLVEMEPAVAPDGESLVFVDWREGGLYRAPLAGGGAP